MKKNLSELVFFSAYEEKKITCWQESPGSCSCCCQSPSRSPQSSHSCPQTHYPWTTCQTSPETCPRICPCSSWLFSSRLSAWCRLEWSQWDPWSSCECWCPDVELIFNFIINYYFIIIYFFINLILNHLWSPKTRQPMGYQMLGQYHSKRQLLVRKVHSY